MASVSQLQSKDRTTPDPLRPDKRHVENNLDKLGRSESVLRFARRYSNPKSKGHFLEGLRIWVEWLHDKGIALPPDELATS